MGIYIKDMKLPENCTVCPMEQEYWCGMRWEAKNKDDFRTSWERRREDCPLVEIKDHGDLVDIDTIPTIALQVNVGAGSGTAFKLDYSDIPVVIPADRGKV